MTIEEALVLKLESVLGHARVYPGQLPEGLALYPAVVYRHAGDDDRVHLSGGRSATRVDVFELEVWHPDDGATAARAALAVARELVKDALAGANARGWWGGTGTGVFVTGAVARDADGDDQPPADASEHPLRTERLTVRVNWRAA